MQTFEIKRGHGKTLDNGGLKKLMEEEFGSVDNSDDTTFNASFKALKSIVVEHRSIKEIGVETETDNEASPCLLYTSPSPRDMRRSRMPSSA